MNKKNQETKSSKDNPNSESARELAKRHYIEASQPVVDELRQKGYGINAIQDLYRNYSTYKSAIPILLKWLPRIHHSDLREALLVRTTILHALNNKCAKPEAMRPLVQAYESFKPIEALSEYVNGNYLFTIGNVLGLIADDSIADDLIRIATCQKYKSARVGIIEGLGKLKDPRIDGVLIDLLDDDSDPCLGMVIKALGLRRVKKAFSKIEEFVNHPKGLIRSEAKAAIKRIKGDSKGKGG